MRAAIVRKKGGPEVLEVVGDYPKPEAKGATDVVVRVQAASVNRIDCYLRAGLVPTLARKPWVLGGDAYGTVAEVGSGVTRLKVGDPVFGMLKFARGKGCYAEYALFDESYLAT